MSIPEIRAEAWEGDEQVIVVSGLGVHDLRCRTSRIREERVMSKYAAYVLRTCSADMTSHGDFRWPKRGRVEAPDWKPTVECGNGLHGLLWGEGDGTLLDWSDDAVWQVVGLTADELAATVDLGGKVKFPSGTVVHTGDQKSATDYITARGARGPVVGCFRVGGYRSTVSGGDDSTVSGGHRSTVSGGYRSTVSGGDRSTLSVQWWDGQYVRIAVAYVGENGIKPNVAYRVNERGEWEEADHEPR